MEKLNVLVTGGGRGIGEGIVRALAGAGHNVAFCGRAAVEENSGKVEALQNEFGVKAAYYRCDVSCAADRERLLADFIGDFGHLDMLVNNAGVAPDVRADLLEMSEESFERVMRINLQGPFFLTQAAAKLMSAGGGFRAIVNIGSISADVASISRGEYCMSKAGVAMATKLFAVRLAEFGILVYELRPGVVKSDMTSVVAAKYDKLIAEGLTLQKRWGYPEDLGKAVAALASGAFAYSTGQVINVDGGMTVERL